MSSCSRSSGVEHAPALVRGERLVPVRRNRERVPADEHRARLLGVVEPRQHVREADDRAGRAAAGAADRLRQPVVGAVGERVAVHDEERLHSVPRARRSRSSGGRSQRAPPCARRRRRGRPARPAGRRPPAAGRSAVSRSVPAIAAGISGTPASRAIRAAPVCGRGPALPGRPFSRRVPSGKIATTSPVAREVDRGLDRRPRLRSPAEPETRRRA